MLKTLLVSGLLLFASFSSIAQSAPAPLSYPGRFCVVRSYGTLADSRPSFTLDYGVPSKTNKMPDEQSYAESFKMESLRSLPDMLNYMDRNGWELMQTTSAGTNQGSGLSAVVAYQYIFRRKTGQ